MHSLLMVVGPSLTQQLHPFADTTEVDPYWVWLEEEDVARMADHYDLPVDDFSALATRMSDWNGAEGEVREGRLGFWTRANPNGKFDWYKVGGRFAGYLQLRKPRPASWLGRLCGKTRVRRVDRALKGEVVVEEILANPPFALLVEGSWNEQGWGSEALSDEAWRVRFTQLLEPVSDHELLSAVDLHS